VVTWISSQVTTPFSTYILIDGYDIAHLVQPPRLSRPGQTCECPGYLASDLARRPEYLASHPYVSGGSLGCGIDGAQDAVS
jgi:hypothetical protein